MCVAVATTALIAALAVTSASAQAESYTLDGLKSPAESAIKLSGDEGGGCSMTPSTDGTYACFTSKAKRSAAVKDSIQKNQVPAGSTALPSKSAIAATKSTVRAAYSCDGATQVWPHSNKSGAYGWFDYVPNWTNFASSWNNVISSDWTSSYYHAFYHDGVNGSGHYLAGSG